MGDVEQRHRWPRHTEHRLTLCFCHHPGSCTHRVCSSPDGQQVAIPSGRGAPRGGPHCGVSWAQAVGLKELGAPLPHGSLLCPSEPLCPCSVAGLVLIPQAGSCPLGATGHLAVPPPAGTPGTQHSTLGCVLVPQGWGLGWGEDALGVSKAVTAPAPHGWPGRCPGSRGGWLLSQPCLSALLMMLLISTDEGGGWAEDPMSPATPSRGHVRVAEGPPQAGKKQTPAGYWR